MALWRRLVAQACIYGVDVNPLAVELAKLSLWLAAVGRDKPLTFLDHHLRCGNSLIGANMANLLLEGSSSPIARRTIKVSSSRRQRKAEQAGQLSLWAGSELSDTPQVDELGDEHTSLNHNSLSDENTGEPGHQASRCEALQRYRALADVWTARYFGLTIGEDIWQGLAGYVLQSGLELPLYARLAEQAHAINSPRHTFHWELEFPHIFFDEHGSLLAGAGFDAVIGSIPDNGRDTWAAPKPYLEAAYPELYAEPADLFVYFFGQGFRLLKTGRRLAYISSNSWLRANYATPLRAFLRSEAAVESLVDLGDNRVFADAPDVYPAILVVRRDQPAANHRALAAAFSRGEGLTDFAAQLQAKFFPLPIHDQSDSGWQIDSDAGRILFRKLMARGRPLGEVVNGQMYYGVKTGLNDAFVIDQATRDMLVKADPAGRELLKPMLRGEDLRPWYQEDEGRWLILLPHGWTAATFGQGLDEESAWQKFTAAYPALSQYLEPFAAAGRKRQDKGEFWWELRPCDYYDAFEQTKILWPELAKQPRFSWDGQGLYINNKGYLAPAQNLWLLGLLNSRTVWFLIMKLCLGLGERAGMERFQLFAQYISKLPIPETSSDQQEQIGALAIAISERAAARYTLHRHTRHRILTDLTAEPGRPLNQKLTAWWQLDFPAFRAEVRKSLKQDIPLRQRHDWEQWLAEQQQSHSQLTAALIHLETELNQHVYNLFDLTAAEIHLIEQTTKYAYGET